MLFYNGDAAAWSCFGLICAVLLAFIVHYYWKKNKGGNIVPTSEGYEGFQFEKQQLEEENQKLKKEIEELKGQFEGVRKEHEKLKNENVSLQEREKYLNLDNQKLTDDLNHLKERREALQNQNSELEKEKAGLSTEKANLLKSEGELKDRLKQSKEELQRLQEEQTKLREKVTGLTHEKDQYLKESAKIEERCKKALDFYETLRDNGIEVDIEVLLHYKEFHMKHRKFIEVEEQKKEKERGSISKGREYELSWKDDLKEHFTEKEWEFIDIDSQPVVGDGKRGDYKVTFRDSENSSTSINQLHIYVEHKYTQEAKNTVGEPDAVKHNQMNDDLKKAFENVSKGGEYDFIFLITNREIGQDRFREKGFFWISSDKDYQSFGLPPPARTKKSNQQVKPAIIIMTRAKSFEFLWNFYTLWKNWSSHNVIQEPDMLVKQINEVFSSENFKKNLIKWINESDQFNLEIGEKMEKQWHELMDRLRILSEFWSRKKKQAYSLNRKAIKLRNNAEWSTEDEEESTVTPQLAAESSSTVKENSVSKINSKVNIEQREVRDNVSSNT